MNTVKYIIMHHSATKDDVTVNWDDITKYHTSWRYNGNIITPFKAEELIKKGIKGVEAPWRDIGYHWGVEMVNNKIVVSQGRPETIAGAHTKQQNMNSQSLGICVIGNYDLVAPSDEIMFVLADLCTQKVIQYGLTIDRIKGHKDFANKTCPGKMFDLDRLRVLVRHEVSQYEKN